MLQTEMGYDTVSVMDTILQVEVKDIPFVWWKAKPLLERAMKYVKGEFTLEDIYSFLCKGTMQLFIRIADDGIKLALVTEIVQYPQRRIVRITLAAGSGLREAESYLPTFYNWVLANGASELEAFARPAMVRLLKGFGYKTEYTVVRLDLKRRMH